MTKKQKKFAYYSGAGLIIVAIIGYNVASNSSNVPIEVESPSSLGQQHVQDTSQSVYNSNPPTSGDHLGSPAQPGFYEKQVPDGALIHNLEHGYVVINYDCGEEIKYDETAFNLVPAALASHPGDSEVTDESPEVNQGGPLKSQVGLGPEFESADCEVLKDKIETIVRDDSWKVIGNPRPENDSLISVTAWNKVMHLDSFNADKIKTFIKKYRNKAPEKTPN